MSGPTAAYTHAYSLLLDTSDNSLILIEAPV